VFILAGEDERIQKLQICFAQGSKVHAQKETFTVNKNRNAFLQEACVNFQNTIFGFVGICLETNFKAME
jgi:hypothetical protein